MENKHILKLERSNIYAGKVTNVSEGIDYRKILFRINDDNLSEDILFFSPNHYNIEGTSSLITFNPNIVITDVVKLEELLCCIGLEELLQEDDIKRIYYLFLKNKVLNNNLVCVNREKIPYEVINRLRELSKLSRKPSKAEPNYQLIKTRIHLINN